MSSEPPTVAKSPCASCPYRCDVPSGIWHPDEYAKLLIYDGEIAEQAVAGAYGLFMCHQRDGKLCVGWVGTHGPDNLLALRVQRVADEVFDYESPVPLFASGAEARKHGLQDVPAPGEDAQRIMRGLVRRRLGTVRPGE